MSCRYGGDHGVVLTKGLSLPCLTHRDEGVFHHGAALVHVETERGKLLGQVADANTENQPAVRKRIE